MADTLARSLMPCAVGMYPKAEGHLVERRNPIDEHILIVCLHGNGILRLGAQSLEVGYGDAVLIPAGAPHLYGAAQDKPWSISWVHFLGRDAAEFVKRLDGPMIRLDDPANAHQALAEIWSVLHASQAPHDLAYCSAVLRHLFSRILMRQPAPEHQSQSAHEKMLTTTEWMRNHLRDGGSLAEFAALAHLSVPHYCHLFRTRFHCSPMEYYTRLRMQRAAELLLTTSATAQEIAYELGYSDPYYFSRVFRKTMGLPPRTYRVKHRA